MIAGIARRTIYTDYCVTAAEGTKDHPGETQREERRRKKKGRDTGREGIRGKIERYRDVAIARVDKAPDISTGYGSGGWTCAHFFVDEELKFHVSWPAGFRPATAVAQKMRGADGAIPLPFNRK